MQPVPGADFYFEHLQRARTLPEADRSADVRAWLATHDAQDALAPLFPVLQPGPAMTEHLDSSAALAALLQYLAHSHCHPPADPKHPAFILLQRFSTQISPLMQF